jgi:hypothetical protein
MRTRIFSTLRGSAWALSIVGAVGAAAGVTGCFLNEKEEVAGTADEVNSGAEVSLLLKSTLVLEAGCVATKIGPRHLLLSARCVSQHKEAFAKGKTLAFKTANNAKEGTGTNAVLEESGSGRRDSGATDSGSTSTGSSDSGSSDAGAPKADGGSTDAGRTDAGSTTTTTGPKEGSSRIATVYETVLHPSYESKCSGADDPCGFGKLAAGDAADVALVILDLDLEGVEAVPVDLDSVGQADPILVIASGCDIVGAEQGTGIFTKKTGAVPAKSVVHVGSPYKAEPAKAGSLGQTYVVTAGPAWKKNEAKMCTSDFGAPVFRAGVAAVAGVTANFTTFGPDTFSPVTVEHTRVDEGGRFKIGNWLESQGAQTIHSCSEMSGGCVKHEYEGGAPVPPSAGPTTGGGTTEPGDAGNADAIAPSGDGGAADDDAGQTTDPPSSGLGSSQEEQLADQGPPEESYSDGEDDEDYADAAAPKKKKKTEESGCSAAPGPMPAGETGLAFGVGLAVMAIGRRRRSK